MSTPRAATTTDPKLTKGKAREDAHWQLGWWELSPLVDGPHRPVAWSRSSILYSAHATQPMVLARHFPSLRQFIVPSPSQVLDNLSSYEPPTVVSISPGEEWLFAYFPGRERDGVGCLWRRGHQLDSWIVRERFTYARGGGIVAAAWHSNERPWVLGEQGAPFRLPPRGSILPSNSPTLLLVTETHNLHACFLPPAQLTIKVVKTSLLQHSFANFDTASTNDPHRDPHGGRRVCLKAAIGLIYNEPLIIVALRSQILPPVAPPHSDYNSMDLGLPLDLPHSPPADESVSDESEQWGEESTIELCAVRVNLAQNVQTIPLSPIFKPNARLTDLRFFAIPPEIIPPSPTMTRDPRRPPKDIGVPGVTDKGSLYLVATSLEFAEYSSLPKSEVSVYLISRPGPTTPWLHKHENTRSFGSDTVAFMAPATSRTGVVIGCLDSTGTMPRHAGPSKETKVGRIRVVNLPSLADDEQWEQSLIVAPLDGLGRDFPIEVAVSPNQMLLCSVSSSSLFFSRTLVHSMPRRRHATSQAPHRNELTRSLAASILSRKSPSDVIHALSAHSLSLDIVAQTLYDTVSVLETYPNGLHDMWLDQVLGVVTEIYLARSKTEPDEDTQKTLTNRWKTAHDICSVVALNGAFEDCRDGESYDLAAIWQLVGLCRWLVTLLERLLKQCIFVGENELSLNTVIPYPSSAHVGLWTSSDSSILLHLLHPYALRNLHTAVGHVKRLRDALSPLPPKGENSQIAKDILMDTVDSSGVDLNIFLNILQSLKGAVKLSTEDQRKVLVSCAPLPSCQPYLREAIEKILASDVINRPKLFLKPSELLDGVSRLSISEPVKDRDTDVVSKGLLLHRGANIVCTRCGGQSEVGGDGREGHPSKSWEAWERTWSSRCVCGGAWMRLS